MTYEELQKAMLADRVLSDSGFAIEPNHSGLIMLRANSNHERQKAFRFCEDSTIRGFYTVEEALAFVAGWNECKSMMKLSGQTK